MHVYTLFAVLLSKVIFCLNILTVYTVCAKASLFVSYYPQKIVVEFVSAEELASK